MSPAALDSYLSSTASALVIGRFLTVFAGAAALVLAGFLVRHRGALAVLLTCGILAIYPPSVIAAHTVLLEPWLVLLCLAGAVAVFDRDRITTSTRRLAWGGVACGFGGAIKLWAIVPVLVIAALCLPPVRRAAVFAGGVAAGFLIPVLPFVIASPGRFYTDVVVAQAARIGIRVPAWVRFNTMMGTPKFLTEGTVIALAVTVLVFVVAAQVAASWVARSPPAPLDWFALGSAALIVLMFLWPPYYAAHYAAFLAPFLALSLALPVARLARGLAARRAQRQRAAATTADPATAGQAAKGPPAGRPEPPPARQATRWLAGAGLILIGLAVVAGAAAQARPPSRLTGRFDVPGVSLQLIPKGACVVTDSPSYLLIGDRFTSDRPGCSQMVDPLGTDLALGNGRRPATGASHVPAVIGAWRQAFSTAGWALLTPKNPQRIPWNPALRTFFRERFELVGHVDGYNLYTRERPGPAAT